MVPPINFVTPKNRDYTSYHDQLRQYNISLQRYVGNSLVQRLGRCVDDGCVILTTGSDGRLEKGPQSLMEFMLLRESSRDNLKPLKDVLDSDLNEGFYDPIFESKTLGKQVISAYKGDIDRIFPTRVFDMRFIHGNPDLVFKAHKQIYSELKSTLGGKILNKVRKDARHARHLSESGSSRVKGQEITHFDIDSGASYFDLVGNQVLVGSFKFGPLRLVQYRLASEIIQSVIDEDANSYLDMVYHFPTNTVERLHFLEVENLSGLSHQEVEILSDCYKYFLWQYHLSQEKWRTEGEKRTQFDTKEVQERLKDTIKIATSNRILKKS